MAETKSFELNKTRIDVTPITILFLYFGGKTSVLIYKQHINSQNFDYPCKQSCATSTICSLEGDIQIGGVLFGNVLFPVEFKWGLWLKITLGFSFFLEICVDPPYLGVLNFVSKSIFSQILHNPDVSILACVHTDLKKEPNMALIW